MYNCVTASKNQPLACNITGVAHACTRTCTFPKNRLLGLWQLRNSENLPITLRPKTSCLARQGGGANSVSGPRRCRGTTEPGPCPASGHRVDNGVDGMSIARLEGFLRWNCSFTLLGPRVFIKTWPNPSIGFALCAVAEDTATSDAGTSA